MGFIPRKLVLLIGGAVGGGALVGDITSVVVRADGWSADVTVKGFSTGATYNFGSFDSAPASTSSPTFSIGVVSMGYNSSGVLGTTARTVYGTHVVRKPWPDITVKDEASVGGDLVVRVALSEPIYANDKAGGAGTSGTDPVAAIAAGWCANGGPSNIASIAVTNNSTLEYPSVIAQWAWGHTPAWRRVAADFSIGSIAYHAHGIAAVALSAVGNTSSNLVSATVTAPSAHQMSASGLYYESYDLAVPIAGFTQGEDITLRYVAYPIVGDATAIIDTNLNTASTDDVRGLTNITAKCDKTGELQDFAVVSTTGNDTTGAKSTVLATAAALPFLTIGKALASGATVIYCRAGTMDWLGSTPASVTQRNYAIEIAPYPSESVTLDRSGTWKAYKAKIIRYSGFNLTCGNVNGYLDGGNVAGAKVIFDSISSAISVSLTSANPGYGYRSEGCWLNNYTVTSGQEQFFDYATSRTAYVMTGCLFNAGQVAQTGSAIANKISGGAVDNQRLAQKGTGNPAPYENNAIIANNALLGCNVSANACIQYGETQNQSGVAIIGNLIEVATITTTQPALRVAGDASVTDAVNFILSNNTVVGERCNLFYNDSGTTANVRRNITMCGNAYRSFNIKSDRFNHPTNHENAARVGNWAMMNGVNFSDNLYDGAVDPTFNCDYDDINIAYVTANNSVFGQMQYTAEASSDGTGLGGGNYIPAVGSPLRGHTLTRRIAKFDQTGKSIPSSNACIGAFQV